MSLSITVTDHPGVIILHFSTPVTDLGVTGDRHTLYHTWHTHSASSPALERTGPEQEGTETWEVFLLFLLGMMGHHIYQIIFLF